MDLIAGVSGESGLTPLIGSDADCARLCDHSAETATLRYAHRLGAGDGPYYAVTAQGSKENTVKSEALRVKSADG
jgi:hypothetical protein